MHLAPVQHTCTLHNLTKSNRLILRLVQELLPASRVLLGIGNANGASAIRACRSRGAVVAGGVVRACVGEGGTKSVEMVEPERVEPPVGSWAATARMMAGPNPSDEEAEFWDRWKDEMKEAMYE